MAVGGQENLGYKRDGGRGVIGIFMPFTPRLALFPGVLSAKKEVNSLK